MAVVLTVRNGKVPPIYLSLGDSTMKLLIICCFRTQLTVSVSMRRDRQSSKESINVAGHRKIMLLMLLDLVGITIL